MTTRREGWYWVKEFEDTPWKCQQWNGEWWHGRGMYHEPAKVGPRIPAPDEPWQCVPVEATPEMLKHGFIETQYDEGRRNRMEVYRAMLAAAPKPD